MNEKKGLGLGARAGIAFAMSFVPFLLYMIPPVDAALTSIAVASNPSNPSKSDFVSFMTFGMPCVFFCATLFCFYRADRRKEKAHQNAISTRQEHFANNKRFAELAQELAHKLIFSIEHADRSTNVKIIKVSKSCSVSESSILIDYREEINFNAERVYLKNPAVDMLAITKCITSEAATIVSEQLPDHFYDKNKQITCCYSVNSCNVTGSIQYEAQNASYIEAKPL